MLEWVATISRLQRMHSSELLCDLESHTSSIHMERTGSNSMATENSRSPSRIRRSYMRERMARHQARKIRVILHRRNDRCWHSTKRRVRSVAEECGTIVSQSEILAHRITAAAIARVTV